jgi:hypothetical protein
MPATTIKMALTVPVSLSKLANMEVHFRPETESRLHDLNAADRIREEIYETIQSLVRFLT